MRIIDNLKRGHEILKENNISSYKIDCEILMSQTLNISREKVLLNLEKNMETYLGRASEALSVQYLSLGTLRALTDTYLATSGTFGLFGSATFNRAALIRTASEKGSSARVSQPVSS